MKFDQFFLVAYNCWCQIKSLCVIWFVFCFHLHIACIESPTLYRVQTVYLVYTHVSKQQHIWNVQALNHDRALYAVGMISIKVDAHVCIIISREKWVMGNEYLSYDN